MAPSEGMQLDRKGLKLMREIAELGRQIEFADSVGSRGEKRYAQLVARRVLARREAKSHCAQAGLSWKSFQAALKRSEDA